MCHCRSRTTPGKGGCTRCTRCTRCTKTLQDIQERCYLQEQDVARVWVRPLLSRLLVVRASQARPLQALLWEHHLLWLHTMAQLIQAMTAPTPCSSKPRLLVAQTEKYNDDLSEGLSVINNTTKTTWVKGCQLSTIWVQWRPEWKVISYQWYDDDNLSEGLPIINDTNAKMTCVVDNLCACPFNQC